MTAEREDAVADHWRRFGKWLEEQRLTARLSATEAARRADIHLTSWSRIENGQAGTKRTTLPRILSAVGIGPHDERYIEGYRFAGFVPPSDTRPVMTWTGPAGPVNDASGIQPAGELYIDPDFSDDIDYVAVQAFLEGLPRTLRQEEYERIKRLYVEHRRGQIDFGKKADEE